MKKVIVITGASDGIGKEIATELNKLGNEIIIVGRNNNKVNEVAKSLNSKGIKADFSNFKEVVALAKKLNKLPRIDILINNAGALFNKRKETINKIEQTFEVNVLSSLLLTILLINKLKESKGLVINTTSIAANFVKKQIDLNDLENKINYSAIKAYSRSKLEVLLLTKELHKRYHNNDINFIAYEPGVARTNFASEGNKFINFCFHSPLKYLFTCSPKSSARSVIKLLSSNYNSGCIYKKNGCVYKERLKVSSDYQSKLFDICYSYIKEYL